MVYDAISVPRVSETSLVTLPTDGLGFSQESSVSVYAFKYVLGWNVYQLTKAQETRLKWIWWEW
jgi:hypothetical protein